MAANRLYSPVVQAILAETLVIEKIQLHLPAGTELGNLISVTDIVMYRGAIAIKTSRCQEEISVIFVTGLPLYTILKNYFTHPPSIHTHNNKLK
jgi:hypothetical protein